MIMEVEESLDRLSVGWRPGRAGGVVQSISETLRTKGLML